jgi:hypothetical protein
VLGVAGTGDCTTGVVAWPARRSKAVGRGFMGG